MTFSERQAFSAFLIQSIGIRLNLPLHLIDTSVSVMYKFCSKCRKNPPSIHIAIATLNFVTKYNEKLFGISKLTEITYKLLNIPIDEKVKLVKADICKIEALLLAVVGTSIKTISPEKIIKSFSEKFELSEVIMEPLISMIKTIFYLSDVSVKNSIEQLVAAGIFLFLKLNCSTLQNLNSLPWNYHISKYHIEIETMKRICDNFFDCISHVNIKTKERIIHGIKKCNGYSMKKSLELRNNNYHLTTMKNNEVNQKKNGLKRRFKSDDDNDEEKVMKKPKLNTMLK